MIYCIASAMWPVEPSLMQASDALLQMENVLNFNTEQSGHVPYFFTRKPSLLFRQLLSSESA
jgi:hypothetical protein